MKKDKKFLAELESNLGDIKDKYKQEIIEKYQAIITEGKNNKKKITAILKEIGDPKEVASREIEALGNKGKKNLFASLKDKMNERKEKKKEEKAKKEQSKKDKEKSEKKEKKSFFGIFKSKDKDVKKERVKKERVKKEKVKKEKIKEEKPKKEKKSFKERLAKVKEFFTKDRFGKKERKVEVTPKEVVEEVKEEFEEEIAETSEVVSETHIFESKKTRRKRIFLKTLGIIVTAILLFIWMWVSVLFFASVFAYLDGIKFIGINIALFGLMLLTLWIVIMVNRAIFKHKSSVTLNLIVSIICVLIIAGGTALAIKQVSEIKTVKDVSVKYSMTTKLNTFNLPTDTNNKFILTFNSNYNTQYTVNYDKNLKDKVRVEVKYYECYYDFYTKKTSNGAYFSLKLDDRDRLSVYIDDLKEGLVFDNDELARYIVKISVNENDADRIGIQN